MGQLSEGQDRAPRPYRIDVQDDVLRDLRERLSRTRWPDEIPESEWEYGSSLAFMRRLAEYCRDGFDWRAQETKLNGAFASGFTLSFEPGQRRVGIDAMADLFVALMADVLGYGRFAAQGGDWGRLHRRPAGTRTREAPRHTPQLPTAAPGSAVPRRALRCGSPLPGGD